MAAPPNRPKNMVEALNQRRPWWTIEFLWHELLARNHPIIKASEKSYVKKSLFQLHCACPLDLIIATMNGTLPQKLWGAPHVQNQDLVNWTRAVRDNANLKLDGRVSAQGDTRKGQPSAYAYFFVNNLAKSPTAEEFSRILDGLEVYIDPNPDDKDNGYAYRVDKAIESTFTPRKHWPESKSKKGMRKYLSRTQIIENMDEDEDYSSRRKTLHEFIENNRQQIKKMPHGQRMRPRIGIGFTTMGDKRFENHQKHVNANLLACVIEAVSMCDNLSYRFRHVFLQGCCSAEEAAILELSWTHYGNAYHDRNGIGVNSAFAGVNLRGRDDITNHAWSVHTRWVLDHSPYKANVKHYNDLNAQELTAWNDYIKKEACKRVATELGDIDSEIRRVEKQNFISTMKFLVTTQVNMTIKALRLARQMHDLEVKRGLNLNFFSQRQFPLPDNPKTCHIIMGEVRKIMGEKDFKECMEARNRFVE